MGGSISCQVDSENKLGEGRFATVYGGKLNGNPVAVKRIETDRLDLGKEALIKELSHPNVVQLLHIKEDGPFRLCFLELCDGTLRDYCNGRYQGPKLQEVDGLLQMARGLAHIHSANLIHRQVKPENVLYAPSATADVPILFKLSDFGLLRTPCTRGIENYMPPEMQKLLESTEGRDDSMPEALAGGSQAADVFAMGCVFFYYLTNGMHPFGKRHSVVSNVLRGKSDISKVQSHFSCTLIGQMIDADPQSRPDMTAVVETCIEESDKRYTAVSEGAMQVLQSKQRHRYQSIYEEKQDVRLAEAFVDRSQVHMRGHPSIFLLEADETVNRKDSVRWIELGRAKDSVPHKTILLLGASGSGKSTLVEEMVNHILDVQWDDPFRFKIVPDQDTWPNRTNHVTAYTLHHTEGFGIPHSLTIIDTPGYSDDLEADERISDSIDTFIHRNKVQVDAVCLVARSADAQPTALQKFISDPTAPLLADQKQVKLFATFCDGSTPRLPEAGRPSLHPIFDSDGKATECFKLASAVFAYNKSGDESLEASWQMNRESLQSFFKSISSPPNKTKKRTRSILRRVVSDSIKLIDEQITTNLNRIGRLQRKRQQLDDIFRLNDWNRSTAAGDELISVMKPCDDGFAAYNCTRCRATCYTCSLQQTKTWKPDNCPNSECQCPAADHQVQEHFWQRQLWKHRQHGSYEQYVGSIFEEYSKEMVTIKNKTLDLFSKLFEYREDLLSAGFAASFQSVDDYVRTRTARLLLAKSDDYQIEISVLSQLLILWRNGRFLFHKPRTSTRLASTAKLPHRNVADRHQSPLAPSNPTQRTEMDQNGMPSDGEETEDGGSRMSLLIDFTDGHSPPSESTKEAEGSPHDQVASTAAVEPPRQTLPFKNKEINIIDMQDEKQFDSDCYPRRKSRLAEAMVACSALRREGAPAVYSLKSSRVSSASQPWRWFDIGQPTDSVAHKIIFLMGATGSGKSTLVDAMVNYILGVRYDDPFRFTVVDQGDPETRCIAVFSIHHTTGMSVPYSLTIVDTPGFVNSDDQAADEEIIRMICKFLTHPEGKVDDINALCLVTSSVETRLSLTQEYVVSSMLSILGSDVIDHVQLMATFTDGSVPPVVEACLGAKFPFKKDPHTKRLVDFYKFNNSVTLAGTGGDAKLDQVYWDLLTSNLQTFFQALDRLPPKSLQRSRDTIRQGLELESSSDAIRQQLDVSLEKVYELESAKQRHQESLEQLRLHQLGRTKRTLHEGCIAYNCKDCGVTCGKLYGSLKSSSGNHSLCYYRKCDCLHVDHEFRDYEIVSAEQPKQEQVHLNEAYEEAAQDIIQKCEKELVGMKNAVLYRFQKLSDIGERLSQMGLRSSAQKTETYVAALQSRLDANKPDEFREKKEILFQLLKKWHSGKYYEF